jgi:septum site-determining protein MinC
VSSAALQQPSIRFRGRSFLALVLAPEHPLADWLVRVEDWSARSPGFFLGRPILLDVTGLGLVRDDFALLLQGLAGLGIRVMGIEGAEQAELDPAMPPALKGGRPAGVIEVMNGRGEAAPARAPVDDGRPGPAPAAAEPSPAEAQAQAAPLPPATAQGLIVEGSVRSGQSIIHTEGDVTVMGSIASGAEVVAGGSLHVYGAIRGRAIAGSLGHPRARIFCRRLEAELLAIDGLYKTADDMNPALRGRPVQAWLEDDTMKLTVLD